MVASVGASHTHRMRVAYGDCDPSGVVFNPNYLVFYDVALTEFWRAHAGGYGAMMEEGVDLQVVEATARFKAPARFDDEIDVTIEVTRLGNTSMITSGAIQPRRLAARRARPRLRLRRRHGADEGADPRAVPDGFRGLAPDRSRIEKRRG